MAWYNPADWFRKKPLALPEAKAISMAEGPATGEGLIAGLYASSQPPRRGTRELLNAPRYMPWLKAVIDKIADGVASTNWRVYRVANREVRRQIKNTGSWEKRQEIYKAMNVPKDAVEVTNHPFLRLWERFNPMLTGRNGVTAVQNHLDLKGETFIMLVRDPGTGDVAELWPLPPHWVVNLPNPSQKHPSFEVHAPNWRKMIPAEDIIWLKHPDPANPYGRGVGIAESLADELDSAEYASKHVKSWFYNRGIPELLVGIEGAKQERLQEAKLDFDNKFRGKGRGYGTYFHPGKIDVHQLNQSFADQQLLEFLIQKRDVVLQSYGIPPEIVGIVEDSNRATAQAADFLFARWVLTPRLEFFRVELNSSLMPEFDDGLVLDYDNPVPEDKQHQLDVIREVPYAFSIDEIREVAEMAALDGDEGGVKPVPTGIYFVDSYDEVEVPEEAEESDDSSDAFDSF